jgi:hypothetical protein
MAYSVSSIMLAEIGDLFFIPFVLFAVTFWIWILVDCAKHEVEGSSKIAWLLIILFAGPIGAPLYFFVRGLPRRRHPQFHPASPLHQPWRKNQRIQ